MKYLLQIFSVSLLFTACQDELTIPKPTLYLRTNFPDHEYKKFNDACPYQFEVNKIYEVKEVMENDSRTCHKDINLGPLKGNISFSYIEMVEPLSVYVNYSNDRVEEHQIKATGIESEHFINSEEQVYGTIFKLEGDVATPIQFYITDSVSNFASGVVYFNSVPNYDSIKPTLDYLSVDIQHLLNTFKWEQ